MNVHAGVARARLSPPWGVELAGWGYYLGRAWQRVRDHTAATALVIDDETMAIAIVAVDLMYADAAFTRRVRQEVARHTDIRPEAVCVACSHSHSTPTAALIRGAGEVDEAYVAWAARQAATAVIQAWRQRRPARLAAGGTQLKGWTYNRTRDGGPVDDHLTVWRVDDLDGRPFAAVVNFAGHPVVQMSLGTADLSRDVPGQVTDMVEAALPGVTALYLQGACGDLNFDLRYHEPAKCHLPGQAVAGAALEALAGATAVEGEHVSARVRPVSLPARRWRREEVEAVRQECTHRAKTGDTAGWLDGFAKVVVNFPSRLPERYGGDTEKAVRAVARFGLEWSEEALRDLEARPETIAAEAQALRVGGAGLVANGSEFFSSLALEVRRRCGVRDVLIAGYANESLGYLPDAHDVEKKTYAAYQSPKFKGQFPFTERAGLAMAEAMVAAIGEK